MKKTMAMLIWLRYHLFVNRIRQRKVWYATLCLMFLVLVFSGSSLFGAFFYVIQSLVRAENPPLFREVVHLLCLGIFLGWIFLGVFWGMSSPDVSYLSRLVRFSLTFRRLYGASILSGLFGYWIVVFGPVFVWLAISLKLTGNLLTTVLSLFSIILFVGVTHLLVYVLGLWLGVSMRFLSAKKLLSVSLVAMVFTFLTVAAIMCINYSDRIQTLSDLLLRPRLSRYLIFAPSGLFAELLLSIANGRYASCFPVSVSGLLIYLGLGWWAGGTLMRWMLFERSFNFQKVDICRSNLFEKLCDLLKGLIPSPYLPIMVRDILYLMRSTRVKVMLIVTAGWALAVPFVYVAFRSSVTSKTLLLLLPLSIAGYGLWGNIFGLESKGMVNSYLFPLQKRQVLIGKNLALILLQWVPIIPGLLWTLYLSWEHTLWAERLSLVMILCYLAIFNALLGNIVSLRFPLYLKFDEIVGRYMSLSAEVLFLFGILCAVIPLGVNMYFFYYLYPGYQVMVGIFAILCVLMLVLYWFSLLRAERIFEKRKEEILAEFRWA